MTIAEPEPVTNTKEREMTEGEEMSGIKSLAKKTD